MATAIKEEKQILNIIKKLSSDSKEKAISYIRYLAFEEEKPTTKGEILDDIKEGVKELNLILKGKKKSRPIKELLNEL